MKPLIQSHTVEGADITRGAELRSCLPSSLTPVLTAQSPRKTQATEPASCRARSMENIFAGTHQNPAEPVPKHFLFPSVCPLARTTLRHWRSGLHVFPLDDTLGTLGFALRPNTIRQAEGDTKRTFVGGFGLLESPECPISGKRRRPRRSPQGISRTAGIQGSSTPIPGKLC